MDNSGKSYPIDSTNTTAALIFTLLPDEDINMALTLKANLPLTITALQVQLGGITCPGGGRTLLIQCQASFTAKL